MAGNDTDDSADAITVERDLAVRDGGVLATYSLSAADDDAVTAEVVDRLPSQCDRVREIGVHPEFEPADSEVGEDHIVFRDTVDPGDELVVKYGISAGDPVDEAALAEWEEASTPRAVIAEDGASAPLTRGGATEALSKSAEVFASAKDSILGGADAVASLDDDVEADADGVEADAGDSVPEPNGNHVAVDLESGNDAILDDLTDADEFGASDEAPRDFVAELSDDADGPAGGAALDFESDAEAPTDDGSSRGAGDEGLSTVADRLDSASASGTIRVDRFRSRLTGLAGSSIALHAVEDDAVAEALLSGMADEVEAINDEFQALRAEFEDGE